MTDKPTETPATPAGNAGATTTLTLDQVKQAVAETVTPLAQQVEQLATDVKPLAGRINQVEEGLKAAPTADAIKQIVTDQVKASADAQAASQAETAKRSEFVQANLADVPEIYHGALGSDPEKFEANAKAIRAKYQADLKAAGITAPNVGGDAEAGGGTPAGGAVDTSKLTAMELIETGVAQTSGKTTPPTDADRKADADGSAGGDGEKKD